MTTIYSGIRSANIYVCVYISIAPFAFVYITCKTEFRQLSEMLHREDLFCIPFGCARKHFFLGKILRNLKNEKDIMIIGTFAGRAKGILAGIRVDRGSAQR